jgi:TrmH family RNA methyltransferase
VAKATSLFAEFEHSALAALTVVLVRARNPLNIGAVARAMSNFGCSDLRLVDVHAPSYEDAVSAVGPSQEILHAARLYESLAEAIADCGLVYGTLAPHGRAPQQPMEPLPQAAARLRTQLAGGDRVALLFGSEKTGLSNHEFSFCHGVLGIPSRSEHASMNLGQAAAVCLYALMVTRVPHKSAQNADVCGAPLDSPELLPLAEADHVDRITALLAEALAAANYVGIGRPWADDNLRSLVRRLRVPQQDASALTGMLRKIVHVLERAKK